MAKRSKQCWLYVVVAGIVCATLNSAQADSITALPNPFALSRLNANPTPLTLADEKGAFESKDGAPDSTTIEESEGMSSNFVYYSSLQVVDPSLLGGGGFGGGGGFVGGGGGGGGFGVPIPGVDYYPDDEQTQTNNAPVPAPGAAVLGLIGLGMVRRFNRRFA